MDERARHGLTPRAMPRTRALNPAFAAMVAAATRGDAASIAEHVWACDDAAECDTCGEILCPYNEPLHFHHDGCPACARASDAERDRLIAKYARLFGVGQHVTHNGLTISVPADDDPGSVVCIRNVEAAYTLVAPEGTVVLGTKNHTRAGLAARLVTAYQFH